MEREQTKVLFIDDDPDLLSALRAAFEADGFEFNGVGTAVEGMDALAAGTYDLIVLDGLLPDDTGINVAAKIRAMPGHENTKIIFFSSYFKQASLFKKLKTGIGVDLVLHKPFPPEILIDAAHDLLGTRRKAAPADNDPFADMRKEYADSFYDKLLAIEALMEKLAAGHEQGPLMKGLLFITHKMHGTAGIFGFNHVSIAAAGWEDELHSMIESGEAVDEAALERFKCYYDWLKINFQMPDFLDAPEVEDEVAAAGCDEEVTRKDAAEVEAAGEDNPSGSAAPDVLVVDDDTVVQNLLSYALEIRGYRYESLYDGNEAWQKLTNPGAEHPKLVLLDVNLPGLDGYTLLREVRSKPALSDVKVIIISARGREEDIVKGFEAGASDFVVKPFSVPVLMHKIRLAIGPRV